ncbi:MULTISPECIES: hypothetical protein [unclassified Frankia]|uniref:hypothetical protein n=1 Tax=unclassified Frankia TaxID=2632575 RepID=UPI002AD502FC|nr:MULTISPECIES: hypothetical protein [unclassified Frankia]
MAQDKGRERRKRELGGRGQQDGREAGLRTCDTCRGTGKVLKDTLERDEEGGFTGSNEVDCTVCQGKGTIGG